MNKFIEINDENFKEHTSNGYVLVDFRADWCPPCLMMNSVMEKVIDNTDFNDIKFLSVNIDKNNEVANEHDISSIPTFLLMKDGKIMNRLTGLQTTKNMSNVLYDLIK
ncbi:thioredoxin family protein [Apilactobacillus xinyiensis]|uniref:thioredoxin family protein n=1 Tax=Apilactobacillus xinyiensis TaxID=2841032 RepID=UPI00200F5068|nr:thioredoxin family protein [Apilactobacillus xinyiensis]MCL0329864.1 thioredoxin family protein [Apilactobacillus xinyiensis]